MNPPFWRFYQLFLTELLTAEEYITKIFTSGKIGSIRSRYVPPLSFARKKDGSSCKVVDYYGLKRIMRCSITAIHPSDKMLERVEQARVFPKIDRKTGFLQTCIHPNNSEKTVFITIYG